MFNNILSTLQFSSKSLDELRSYKRKEIRERYIRGVGLFFVIMALVIQVLAVTSSPKTGASPSQNDILPGGVSSQGQIINDCNRNFNDAATLYNWYGVTCNDIANHAWAVWINSTDYSGNLWSVGHLPYGLHGETPQTVNGKTVYWRPLHAWDSGSSSRYEALKINASNGKVFFILFTCGNLVSIGLPTHYVPPKPTPPPPAPKPTPPIPTPTPTPAPTPTPPPVIKCQYNDQIPQSSPECKPCTASANIYDAIDCLTYSKAASNTTQSIADANNTTAKAGDVIQYTLSVTNTGKAPVKDFVIQENISDVLDYANSLSLNGGTLGSSNILSWPANTIPGGKTVQVQFSIQVKNPVPTNPPAADDPQGFNMIMTNVYGNTINIKVQPPITVATAQVAAKSLPNTGPGLNIFIMSVFSMLAGYFYFRSRLLVHETSALESYVSENRNENE